MDRQRRHLILLFVTLFQILVGFGVIIPILPGFVQSLGGTSMTMGLLVTVWAGAQFVFSPIWGKLSDQVGRRPVLMVGLAGYCVAFLGMALADRLWILVLARLLGGALSAATIPVAQAYIADITPVPAERGQRMAWMGGAMNLGFIFGPAIGGLLAPLGVQTTFYIVAGMAAANLVATFMMLPEPEVQTARTQRDQPSRIETFRIALTGPMAAFSILALICTYGGSTMFSMMGFFMMGRFDAGPELIAAVFFTEGVWATGVQAFGVGWALRRFGEEQTIRYSLVMGVVGFLLLAWSPNLAALFVASWIISVAISFMRPTVAAMASKRTTLEQGVTMGVQTSFDSLGRAIGPSVAGLLYAGAPWIPFAGAALLYAASFVWTGTSPSFGRAVPEPAADD